MRDAGHANVIMVLHSDKGTTRVQHELGNEKARAAVHLANNGHVDAHVRADTAMQGCTAPVTQAKEQAHG